IEYAIRYFEHLVKTYGQDKERKTEIRIFDDVDAKKVVVRNQKLYVNREEGFVGTGLRKDEYICDCSDIDDIIVFTQDGKMQVVRVDTKVFIGKDIIHAAVFKKKDKRTIYNMIYRDGKNGPSYIKRFPVTGITRDKPYDLTNGSSGSTVLYFSANPNGEAEVVQVLLRNNGKIKKLKWELDFADMQIKGRA
ncbi:MAG: DNA gyrase/topoisomerase IV subunit A, partial [Flavobacteriaceae bacterium]